MEQMTINNKTKGEKLVKEQCWRDQEDNRRNRHKGKKF